MSSPASFFSFCPISLILFNSIHYFSKGRSMSGPASVFVKELLVPFGEGRHLEGQVAYPEVPGDIAILLTHPHPKFGGRMTNNVVAALFAALPLWFRCHSVLRFNFRGVGCSSGESTWTGWSERDDVRSMAAHLMELLPQQQGWPPPKRLVIIGYSFGSAVACGVAEEIPSCVGTVAISYPAGWSSSLLFSSHYRPLRRSTVPKLFLMGDC